MPKPFRTLVPGKVRVLGIAKRRCVPELKIPPRPPGPPARWRGRRHTVASAQRRRWWLRYRLLRVDVPVLDLLRCTAEEAARLVTAWDERGHGDRWLPERTLRGYIQYPVAKPVAVQIEPCTWKRRSRRAGGPLRSLQFQPYKPYKDMCVGWFLWALAQAYKQVYERHEEFGVWGHDLGDLCFTSISVSNGRFRVGVDS
jgi:hypothetical protein